MHKVSRMDFGSQDYSQYLDLAITYGMKLIVSIIIFVIGKWVAKALSNATEKLMTRGKIDFTLVKFAGNIVYVLLLAVVIMAAISNLGIQTTSFVALLGAVGLAVGLALQGSLANVGAAVLIILFRPFRVGDLIQAAGTLGTVEEVSMFSTILGTLDGKTIIIPNSAVIGGTITNFSLKATKRVDLTFGIGYDDDLRAAKSLLEGIASGDPLVLTEPAPMVAVSELGDNSVNFTYRVWVNTPDYWTVYFGTIEKVKLAFDDNGISIPYPQMDVHLDQQKEEKTI
jgi:small conductance mechanosensitive channel